MKEKFNSFRVEQTILVYVNVGRMIENFKRGQIRIILTDCIDKQEEKNLKMVQKKEHSDLKKKHKKKSLKDKVREDQAELEEAEEPTVKQKKRKEKSERKKKALSTEVEDPEIVSD